MTGWKLTSGSVRPSGPLQNRRGSTTEAVCTEDGPGTAGGRPGNKLRREVLGGPFKGRTGIVTIVMVVFPSVEGYERVAFNSAGVLITEARDLEEEAQRERDSS